MQAIAQNRDWFDYISALTPSVIALAVAYIAYRQWRIARQKLRLDLYAKRFAAFEATLHFYQELLGGASTDVAQLEATHRRFITAKIESRFLFSSAPGLTSLMDDFNRAAFIIKGSRDVLKNDGIPKELFSETMQKLHTEQMALEGKLLAIEREMAPYLTFRGLVD